MQLPLEFEARMQEILGNKFPAFIHALNNDSQGSIHCNPDKPTPLPYTMHPIPWCDHGYYLDQRPIFTKDPFWHAGCYYVQEPSGMILLSVLNKVLSGIQEPVVMDICAAPGGKSTLCLDALDGKGVLIANEVDTKRYAILKENLCKWGHKNYITTTQLLNHTAAFCEIADCILIDAPCSGEGLFRKDPFAIQQWNTPLTNHCVQLQKKILPNAWELLKEGGVCIYCTCTFNPEENVKQISQFLANHSANPLEFPEISQYGFVEIHDGPCVGYQAYPHALAGEGFFFCVFRKATKSTLNRKKTLSKNKPRVYQREFKQINQSAISLDQVNYCLSSPFHTTWIQSFQEILPGRFQFPIHFTVKHHKEIPCHALAMHSHLAKLFPSITLDLPSALSYLSKHPIQMTIHLPEKEKGYHIVQYEQVPLGFVNVLSDRWNNVYPTEYRIKKQFKSED